MAAIVVVDANVIVRFLTQVPIDQYTRAVALIEKARIGEAELHLSAAVVAEVAAILHHTYERPQAVVADKLLQLISARGVFVEEDDVVRQSLEYSRTMTDTDFIDAYVAVKARSAGFQVASFDKGLHKRLGTSVFPL
jgi:predicted nucleic-acid-binding protein